MSEEYLIGILNEKFNAFHRDLLDGKKHLCWHAYSRDNYGADETLAIHCIISKDEQTKDWVAKIEHDSGYGSEDIISTDPQVIYSLANLFKPTITK